MILVCVLLIAAMASLLPTSVSAAAGGDGIYNISYGEHRPIYVDIELLSLEAISGKSQTFSADFFVSEAYQDNTHAVTTEPDVDIEVLGLPYDHVDLEFTNSDSVSLQYKFAYASWAKPTVVEHFNATIPDIVGLPWIRVVSRIQGVFKVDLPLHDFPFDHQTVSFNLESPNHDIHHGEFVMDPHSDILSIMKPLTEWTVDGSSKELSTNYYHVFNETYSLALFHIYLTRSPQYYLDKIVSGLTMLVVMSWFLFCLPISDTNRHTCGATIFLALVAYIFIVSGDTPKVAYTTKLGSFINLCVSTVFVCYVYFTIDVALEILAGKAHDQALEAAKKDVQDAKAKYAKTITAARDDELEVLAAMDEDDIEVEGWWDTWDNVKNKLDLAMLAILILCFVITAPLLLQHSNDVTIPEGGISTGTSGGH